MNVRELKAKCRENGLRGYSKLRKLELIAFLKSYSIPIQQQKTKTNETFGMSVEKWICDYLKLTYDQNHFKNRISVVQETIQTKLKKVISKLDIRLFLGNRNSQSDFMLNDRQTLSVKTNFNGFKVCPQNIGQTTKNRFQIYFKTKLDSDREIKKYIMDNVASLTKEYLRILFCCNYLLWVYKDNQGFHVELFQKQSISRTHMINHMFSFSRSLDLWNESNTLRFNGESIGEFQIHRQRNCVKFRFNMKKLKTLLKLKSL